MKTKNGKAFMRKFVVIFTIIFWTVPVLTESKSQSEIRQEKIYQLAGFKVGNKYNSLLFDFNINENFTVGIQYTKYESLNDSNSYKQQRQESILLQWFPFNIGGLYLALHLGRFQILEKRSTLYYAEGVSRSYYESYSINISKPLYGAGFGYRWVFENGISLGIEYIQCKEYILNAPKYYNAITFGNRDTTLVDYYLSKYSSYYNVQPISFLFSIGYSF